MLKRVALAVLILVTLAVVPTTDAGPSHRAPACTTEDDPRGCWFQGHYYPAHYDPS